MFLKHISKCTSIEMKAEVTKTSTDYLYIKAIIVFLNHSKKNRVTDTNKKWTKYAHKPDFPHLDDLLIRID